jgi:hypothetical protein
MKKTPTKRAFIGAPQVQVAQESGECYVSFSCTMLDNTGRLVEGPGGVNYNGMMNGWRSPLTFDSTLASLRQAIVDSVSEKFSDSAIDFVWLDA